MATRTTAAAGSWATGATWVGGVAPGNGDTAVIAHDVTVDSAVTVGTSGAAGTVAITINENKNLTVAPSGTLVCRGDIVFGQGYYNTPYSTLRVEGVLEVDSSASASPGTTAYKVDFSGTNGSNATSLVVQGTAGQYAEVRSNAGGAPGYITAGSALTALVLTAQYAIFRRLGSASQDALLLSGNGAAISVQDTVFDTYGRVGSVYTLNADVPFIWQRVTHKNRQGAVVFAPANYDAPTATRLIDDCVFDGQVNLATTGWTVTDNLFYEPPVLSGAPAAAWERNLLRSAIQNNVQINAALDLDSIYLKDGAISNPHWVQVNFDGDCTVDGAIFINEGNTASDGDAFLAAAPSVPSLYTLIRCMKLPNTDGSGSGTLVSALGSANVTLRVRHCTWHLGSVSAGEAGTVRVGETYNAHAGMLDEVKDNLCWDTVTRAGNYKVHNLNGTPNTDVVSAANADYNCGWNIQAGSMGRGYNTPMTGTPGAHDVDVDPQFVDPTRRLSTFDLLQGGPGTTANCLAELMKRNDPAAGYNPAYTIAAIRDYIRAGYAPTNAAIATAASDGTTMGAVASAAPPSGGGGYFYTRRRRR